MSPHYFSQPVTTFHGRRLPVSALPVGYAALIDAYGLSVPLPRQLSAIGERHKLFTKDNWQIFSPRYTPAATLEGHLTFALKHEGLDLAVLKRLLLAAGPGAVEAIIRAQPTGSYARRIWFLYEWLTGATLDLPNADRGTYANAVDPSMQYAIEGINSPRHRVRNNLTGTPEFCPLVFRTAKLDAYAAMDLAARAREIVSAAPRDLLARTAAFLLLKDSRSSYAIEGESPPQDRIQRWGRAIGEAGRQALDMGELLRLQRLVIGDARFVQMGLRTEGGFVGEHDRETGMPVPDHIDARHEDVPELLNGMITFANDHAHQLDPVVAAAMLAFGFVYAHPFEDGNGRLHRYLIHHTLATRGFTPSGVVFPVSAAILDEIDAYRRVLEDYSARLLPVIEWRATERGNVEMLNDTADFYRYFDATPHAEFLYECVRRTVESDLPDEMRFLRCYDEFCAHIEGVVDMPQRTVDLLFRFLRQNDGRLSHRARTREFVALTDEEAARIEAAYGAAFGAQ